MKKFFFLATILFAVSLVLTGCGPKDKVSQPSSGDVADTSPGSQEYDSSLEGCKENCKYAGDVTACENMCDAFQGAAQGQGFSADELERRQSEPLNLEDYKNL